MKPPTHRRRRTARPPWGWLASALALAGTIGACSFVETEPAPLPSFGSSDAVVSSSSTWRPSDATSTSTWPGSDATTGTGFPILCDTQDPTSADPACDACITAHCCTEFNALSSDPNVQPYFACVLGPMLDGMAGCFATNDPTMDPAGFQMCWDACIDANPEGAHTSDVFNLCITANGCIDNDQTCEQNFLFSQGACDSGYTLIAAECDECMGEKCCTGLGACLMSNTCNTDFNTCTQDGTKPVCATDAAAGELAACGRDHCATACGFASGDGVGGSGGAGGSESGGGGRGGAGGSGGRGGGGRGVGGAGGHGGG